MAATARAAAAINAAAIPETLVESALFGHVKGAFTGAKETRVGLLRSASGGSFFLDEVGDLPSTTQVKLLRVIETNDVYPVGSDTPHEVVLRYIAATHKDLEGMVEERRFRRDLFQRLAGNVIRIPPLRDRPEDIHEIGLEFVGRYFPGTRPDTLGSIHAWLHTRAALEHSWPGNVRELQNAIRNLLLGLPSGAGEAGAATPAAPSPTVVPRAIEDCTATMEMVRSWYLRRVLAHCNDNYTVAARILGLDRSTVRRQAHALKS